MASKTDVSRLVIVAALGMAFGASSWVAAEVRKN
ncbi:hypothetical protein M877_01660 [Streptomyces niveus NCIMB 11891]|nr:hypothetical protein M877_01660 [Streptomyces niveus NCIMB 11891]